MSEASFYQLLLWSWIALAVITMFTLSFFLTAPYGRFIREGWGPRIDSRLGWVAMELPSLLVFVWCYAAAGRPLGEVDTLFLLMWGGHYLHRSLIYPFLLRGGPRQMTLSPLLLGVLFNVGNAYLNGRFLFHFGPARGASWVLDPRFLVGALVFFAGMGINQSADRALRNLRKPGETGYKIPRGGLFERVSCPNYLGESLEWLGWATATWSLSGAAFAFWTIANLYPRARAYHRWYQAQFPDYPSNRKAVVPFVF